jgi:hypothetical protein
VREICLEVGFTSLGSFSRTFTHVIGMSPTAYREAWRTGAGTAGYVPTCAVMSWARPRGEPQAAVLEKQIATARRTDVGHDEETAAASASWSRRAVATA